MPAYKKMESLKNGGSWGKFWWKTCGFEWVKNSMVSYWRESCPLFNALNPRYFFSGISHGLNLFIIKNVNLGGASSNCVFSLQNKSQVNSVSE